MKSEKKDFPIAVVLTITTGRLLSNPIEFHDAIEYIAGEPIFTHQLGSAAKKIKPLIFKQHPDLEKIDRESINENNYQEKLAEFEKLFGATLGIEPFARGEYPSKDALEELEEMTVDKSSIIIVNT